MAIKRIAVLGSGVMGSQIAALCSGCGAQVDLFGMPHDSHPEESAAHALKRLPTIKPSPLIDAHSVELIRPLDYQDHLPELRHCDLIIEAIVEDRQAKLDLYQRIAEHLNPDAVLATNTSGISVHSLLGGMDEQLRPRFLGLHFFNPPRYMRLLEVITTDQTSDDVSHRLVQYLTSNLGKYLIFAKDQPAFIANRIGLFALLSCVHQGQSRELAPATIDALAGPLVARSRSATFRTLDLVGLDVCQKVVAGVYQEAQDDPWREHLRLPEWIEDLIDRGALGAKTGKGVYQKIGDQIHVVSPTTGEYHIADKRIDDSLRKQLKQSPEFADVLLQLAQNRHPQANFLWAIYCDLFQYAAWHAADISPGVREIDLAWRLGFSAKRGVFELAQQAGWPAVVDAVGAAIDSGITLSSEPLPKWCTEINEVYRSSSSFSPAQMNFLNRSTHPVYERQLDPLSLSGEESSFDNLELIRETKSLSCRDLGDGVAVLSFKTRMRAISFELISDMDELLDDLVLTHNALVIWQGEGMFCPGADLYQVLAGVKFGTVDKPADWITGLKQKTFEWLQPDLPAVRHLPPIKQVVESLQSLHMKLRHCDFPVVAAVQNMALGGGCEMLMYCDRVVAHHEAYIGLVEIGVGLLPAGGGCTEMARRVAVLAGEDPLFPQLSRTFKDVAMATVSTGARDALAHRFLNPADVIMANPDELVHIAKINALQMVEQNYIPPSDTDIRVVGELGKANLLTELNNLLTGRWISEHDYLCASKIAHCMCGGDVSENTRMPSALMLKLEVDGFLELLETEPTQARIEHMLRKGKPLRN